LIVAPPRDVASAQVRVRLSSGLRFSNQVVSGGSQTVWRGTARKGHSIEVLLSLAGVTAGAQTVEVTLMEASREDGATVVGSETLIVSVLTR
jgi:hypothetical protein